MIINYLKTTLLIVITLTTLSVKSEVRLISPIDFGTVAIVDNSSVGFIDIDEEGNYALSSNFHVLSAGTYGVVELYDYLPGSQVDLTAVVVQSNSSTPIVSPEKFTLTDAYIISQVTIGPDGIAEVRFGGRIQTSGNGNLTFSETTFTHRLQITVSF